MNLSENLLDKNPGGDSTDLALTKFFHEAYEQSTKAVKEHKAETITGAAVVTGTGMTEVLGRMGKDVSKIPVLDFMATEGPLYSKLLVFAALSQVPLSGLRMARRDEDAPKDLCKAMGMTFGAVEGYVSAEAANSLSIAGHCGRVGLGMAIGAGVGYGLYRGIGYLQGRLQPSHSEGKAFPADEYRTDRLHILSAKLEDQNLTHKPAR